MFNIPTSPLVPIRWYFAAPEAKPFPVPTIWASSLYLDADERAELQIGFDPYAPAKWSNGKAPPGASGQNFCGKLSDFTEPAKGPSPLGPLARTPGGLPVCCNPGFQACIVFTNVLPLPGFIVFAYSPILPPSNAIVFTAFNTPFCDNAIVCPALLVIIHAPGRPFDGLEVVVTETTAGIGDLTWNVDFTNGADLGFIAFDFSDPLTVKLAFVYQVYAGPTYNSDIFADPENTLGNCKPFKLAWTFEGYESAVPLGEEWTITVVQGY